MDGFARLRLTPELREKWQRRADAAFERMYGGKSQEELVTMTEREGLETHLVCSAGECRFFRKNTAGEAGNLLYVGIGGLIPGGGEAQCGGHPDERR